MAVMRTHGRAVQFGENGEDFFQDPRIIRGGGIDRNVVDNITNAFGSEGTENEAAAALQEMIEERGGALTPRNTRRGRAFSRNVTDPDTLVDGISTSAPGTYQPGLYSNTPPKPKGSLQVGRGNTGGIGQLQTILTGAGAQKRSQTALTARPVAGSSDSVSGGSNSTPEQDAYRDHLRRMEDLRNRGLPRYKLDQLNQLGLDAIGQSPRGQFARRSIFL